MAFKGWTTKAVEKKTGVKLKTKKKTNHREDAIEQALIESKIKYIRGYKFSPTRKWKFDFAIPDHNIAIEYEGGIYSGGGHTRGAHYSSDVQKYREATLLGWTILRYTSDDLDCRVKKGKSGKVLFTGQGTQGIINDIKTLINGT